MDDVEPWWLGVQSKHKYILNPWWPPWTLARECLQTTSFNPTKEAAACDAKLLVQLWEVFYRSPPRQAAPWAHYARGLQAARSAQARGLLRVSWPPRAALAKQQRAAEAFLRSADSNSLLPEVSQICKPSEYSISLDTQDSYSLLLLTAITSGNRTFTCQEMPACSTKNM